MTVFTPDVPVTVDQLVGEGKKYTTADELAKGYQNAETFIDQLKREQAELREELSRRLTAEEILRQSQAQAVTPPPVTTREQPPVAEQVDLAERIREVMNQERNQATSEQNLASAIGKLVEVYGTEDKAGEVVRAKARELGVSVEFLQEVASKSPKAFFAQLGITATQTPPATGTQSDVNTAALGATNQGLKDGTWAFYETIRKTDPKRYFSATIQNKMFTDRSRLKEAFYG